MNLSLTKHFNWARACSAVFSLGLAIGAIAHDASPAAAQDKPLAGQTIVLYTFGGTQLETTQELVIKPFEAETGATVVVDDSCCDRLQAAMEAGEFLGDVIVGLDRTQFLSMGAKGWFLSDPRLKKISSDHGVPDPLPSDTMLLLHKYGYVMAAKDSSLPMPKTWSEFFDVKKFPGSRGLIRLDPTVTLEAALLADGVDPSKLYPLDADRAFKKLDALKAETKIVFNSSGADQINNLATGETDYAMVYSNRAFLAKRDGININFSYDDGFVVANGGAILKGAKNVDGAVALLEYHMRPEVLARFAERTGMAPVYEASANLIAPEYRSMMPTASENIGKLHPLNDEFWNANYQQLNEKWVNWLAQ